MFFVGVKTMNPTQKIRFLSFMLLQIQDSSARKLGVKKKSSHFVPPKKKKKASAQT